MPDAKSVEGAPRPVIRKRITRKVVEAGTTPAAGSTAPTADTKYHG